MDMTGMTQSFDPQTTSAGLGRAMVVPPIMPANSFGTSFNMMHGHQQIPQNSYGFTSYTDGSSTTLIPTYGANYIQQRPLPRMMQSFSSSTKGPSFNGSNRQGFIESTPQSQSPPTKTEPLCLTPANRQSSSKTLATPPRSKDIKPLPLTGCDEAHVGSTAVDRLMKIIQDKTQTSQSQLPSIPQSTPVVGASHTLVSRKDSMYRRFYTYEEEEKQILTSGKVQDESRNPKTAKKKYRCTFENCPSSFPQKTHLDIHLRKHTGAKPYVNINRAIDDSRNPGISSGERRFPCEICGKRFGQRSNLSAHRPVHTGAKPFPCKLDGCEKNFTQLGNLKSHHNKFHQETIENLESKLQSGEIDLEANTEFWSYFFTLYKNSNKGIKGRGKDRNISPRSRSSKSHQSAGSSASRYVSSNMRSCHGLMDVGGGASFSSDVSMYDSDASLRSHAMSASVSVNSSFSSATTDGSSSTCSSFTEEITGGYKGSESGSGSGSVIPRGGLAFGDRLY
ncbi:DNA-binding transcription factor [Ciborinia camelliae]|nr:DNA-binding transcription factor [Ciborinia camelliae]